MPLKGKLAGCFARGVQGSGTDVALLVWLRGVDRAGSAFPSLHVAMAVVAALQAKRERFRSAPALALWAVAVALSTLTTKQHYAVDVLRRGHAQ